MDYEKMKKKVATLIWEYHNGEDRCKECGFYRFLGKHEEGCELGELESIVEEGIAKRTEKPVQPE